jgi:hypothetical protein
MTRGRVPHTQIGGDEVGIALAVVCLIHCIFVSLLAVLAPWLFRRLGTGSDWHQILAFVSSFIAVATLWPAYQNRRNRPILVLGGTGLVLLLLGAWAPPDLCCFVWWDEGVGFVRQWTPLSILLTTATPLGCGFLLTAHVMNADFRGPECDDNFGG